MKIPLNYSRRSLTARAVATLSTAGSVALVVFVVASSLMLAAGLRNSLLRAGSDQRAIVMQQGGYAEIGSRVQQSASSIVASVPGVATAANGEPAVSGELVELLPLDRVDGPSRVASVQVRGITPMAFMVRPEVRLIQGRAAEEGLAEAIIGTQIVGVYRGLELGSSFELKKGMPVRIVGIFEAGGSALESEVWTNLHTLQSSTSAAGYLSSITARLTAPAAYGTFAEVLEKQHFSAGVGAERERDYYERISMGLSDLIRGLGGVVAVIFSVGAILAAAITMYAAVAERQKEIGVLRALGFGKRDVLGAFLIESAGLAMIGIALGSVLALLASFADFRTMNAATGAEIAIRFAPSIGVSLIAGLVGLTVGLTGGFLPAVRAAQIDPIRAMRD